MREIPPYLKQLFDNPTANDFDRYEEQFRIHFPDFGQLVMMIRKQAYEQGFRAAEQDDRIHERVYNEGFSDGYSDGYSDGNLIARTDDELQSKQKERV